MNLSWFKPYMGWGVACGLCILIGMKVEHQRMVDKFSKLPKEVDTVRVNLEPQFQDTVWRVATPQYAIDTLTLQKVDTVAIFQEPKHEPFSLHLVSSSYKPVLDSTTVDYSYPLGSAVWSYYGGVQNPPRPQSLRSNILSVGVESYYQTYQSKTDVAAFFQLNLSHLSPIAGYRVVGNSHPSWFVGVRKQWKLF